MKLEFLSRAFFLPLFSSIALASTNTTVNSTVQASVSPPSSSASATNANAPGSFTISMPMTANPGLATAAFGGTSSGGGDIQCDALIRDLASNLKKWIKKGGAESGNLDLSSSLNPSPPGKPYGYADYDSQMLALLELPLDVSCVQPGDANYPVEVDDSAKICKSSVDGSGLHMICDRKLFLGLNTDLQIEQTHHEFAIHVPGLEPDSGPISSYKISTQLSNSISTFAEQRLTVTPSNLPPCSPFVNPVNPTCAALPYSVAVNNPESLASYTMTVTQDVPLMRGAGGWGSRVTGSAFGSWEQGIAEFMNGKLISDLSKEYKINAHYECSLSVLSRHFVMGAYTLKSGAYRIVHVPFSGGDGAEFELYSAEGSSNDDDIIGLSCFSPDNQNTYIDLDWMNSGKPFLKALGRKYFQIN